MKYLKVKGKTRIIRKISYQTENDIECTYKGYLINISLQDTDDFYVTIKAPDGCYIVQGGFGGPFCNYNIKSMDDCLKICLENILSK